MTAVDKNRVVHDLFLGFMKIHMLHHLAHGERYRLAFIKELGRHSYPVSSGARYPMRHDMERVGSLSCTRSIVGGKVRQSSSITDEDKLALVDVKEQMGEWVEEVVEGEGPTSWPNADAAHSEGTHHER
jgi:DNA-binding PadR family transcriptional regulator